MELTLGDGICRARGSLLGTPVHPCSLHLAFDNHNFCIFFSLPLHLLNPDATLRLRTLTHTGTRLHTNRRHRQTHADLPTNSRQTAHTMIQ